VEAGLLELSVLNALEVVEEVASARLK